MHGAAARARLLLPEPPISLHPGSFVQWLLLAAAAVSRPGATSVLVCAPVMTAPAGSSCAARSWGAGMVPLCACLEKVLSFGFWCGLWVLGCQLLLLSC
jgi:hypothetical protein